MSEGLVVTGATVRQGVATVLDDVGFVLPRGTMCALAGPNGAGKTTLLHLILGLLPRAAGAVHLNGLDLRAMAGAARARTVAFVEHAARTDLPVTARDVVMLGRIPYAGTEAEAAQAADACLGRVGLAAFANRPWQTLSGGEQQRVQIARALAQAPALLVLDEPTSHLDLKAQTETLALLRAEAAAGTTVLVAIHDLTLAAAFFDSVLMLKAGRRVAFGPVADTLTAETIRAVYDVDVALVTDPATGRLIVAPRFAG